MNKLRINLDVRNKFIYNIMNILSNKIVVLKKIS